MSDGKPEGGDLPPPHEPAYFVAKAAEMLKRAEQAGNEEDRQTFRALAEHYQGLAKVAERPHI